MYSCIRANAHQLTQFPELVPQLCLNEPDKSYCDTLAQVSQLEKHGCYRIKKEKKYLEYTLCAKCEQRRPIAVEIENPSMRENLVMTSAYARLPVRTDTGGRGGETHAGSPIHGSSFCLGENLTSSDATNRFTPLKIKHLFLKMYVRQHRKR